MSVVKRAVGAPLSVSSRGPEAGEADVEAGGALPAHFVSPLHADQAGRNLWIVGFILAVAAVIVIVELFVMLGQQQQQFLRAVGEVERLHHRHQQHLQQQGPPQPQGRQGAEMAPGEAAEEAVETTGVYALLDNDPMLMSKVTEMFALYGYRQVHPWQDHIGKWNVLWCWRDPFHRSKLSQQVLPRDVRSGQLINHFPGATFTTKVDLVTQFNYPFIPKAFLYPQEAAKWKRYLKDTPGADRFVWVRKNAGHRGVVVTSPREAEKYVREDAKADIFIQRFVYPPHLIEGRKWDIGVYVLVTSLEPLRVYYYDDILVRFCKEAWPEQLSAEQVDTYVIADDYTSPWDFAPFQRYRDSSTKNVKQWMDRYFAAMQPTLDWPAHLQQHTANAIRRVVRQDREAMAAACQDFPDKTRQFFEIYRFDFVFDDKLNPFLMEANMSPNLSPSAHPHLSKMFEKILIDTAKITGIVLGGARAKTPIDAAFEREQAGDWKLIEGE